MQAPRVAQISREPAKRVTPKYEMNIAKKTRRGVLMWVESGELLNVHKCHTPGAYK